MICLISVRSVKEARVSYKREATSFILRLSIRKMPMMMVRPILMRVLAILAPLRAVAIALRQRQMSSFTLLDLIVNLGFQALQRDAPAPAAQKSLIVPPPTVITVLAAWPQGHLRATRP